MIKPVALQAPPLPQTWQAPIGYNPVSTSALTLPFATETQSFNPFQDPYPTLDPSAIVADPLADIPEFVWSRPAPTTGQGMAGGWEVNASTPVRSFPSTTVATTPKQTGDFATKPHRLLYLPLQDRQETTSVALLPGKPGDLTNKSASVSIQFSNEAVSAPATYRSATRPEILTASMGVGGPSFTLEVQDQTSRQALTTLSLKWKRLGM